jgi:hypothetical protein
MSLFKSPEPVRIEVFGTPPLDRFPRETTTLPDSRTASEAVPPRVGATFLRKEVAEVDVTDAGSVACCRSEKWVVSGTARIGGLPLLVGFYNCFCRHRMGLPASLQPASVCPSSAGKQSRKASDGKRPRGRHRALKTPLYIGTDWLWMAPPTGICAFVVGNFSFYGLPVL